MGLQYYCDNCDVNYIEENKVEKEYINRLGNSFRIFENQITAFVPCACRNYCVTKEKTGQEDLAKTAQEKETSLGETFREGKDSHVGLLK